MNAGLVAWTALTACISSLITGYTLKLIEHRREARTAGSLDVRRKRHLDRYEAIKQIQGMGRNLHHSVLHPSGAVDPGSINIIAPQMREMARSNVEVLGEAYVSEVMQLTDLALEIADRVNASGTRHQIGLYASLRYDGAWHDLNKHAIELLK
jgi:hypothetical protein